LQQTGAAQGSNAFEQIERFDYPAGPNAPGSPVWESLAPDAEGGTEEAERDRASGGIEAGMRAGFEQRMGEETRRSFEAGRERGRLEGRQAEREAQAASLKAAEDQRARHGAQLIESFAMERDRYLHAVEREVVELALAVAARILRRETQMDPLLLTGVVRVALGQLSESTHVRLRVPQADLGLWNETIALLPNLALRPEVVAGAGMLLGDCVIETELGSVDLGIRAQLGEIERGFFDRPGGPRGEKAAEPEVAPSAAHQGRP
jgi:flagellar assembly protein FliH